MHTPWGASQTQKKIADGITSYSTASHGGYHVSAARIATMPNCIRAITPWAGTGWYEEDCDWALVALAFPMDFGTRSVFYAVKTIKMSESGYFDKMAGFWETEAGKLAQAQADIFMEENKDKYAQSGFGGSGKGVRVSAYHMTTNARITLSWEPSTRGEDTWMKLPQHFTLEEAEATGADVRTESGYSLVSRAKEAVNA